MASKRPESSDRRSVNQQNAKASTGPRTPAGKTRSAQNAIRHGAYSAAVLVLGESQADFSRLKSELQATLRPEGPLEDRLLNRIALLWWRLERAQRVEQESLEQSLAEACYEASGLAAELTRNNFGGLDHPAPEQNAPTQTAFHWKDGQKLERLDAPAGLRLKVADMHKAPQVAAELRNSMSGELYFRDWSKVNQVWFAAVQTEKKMMFIILALIIAVAAFNLVSSLVMTVTDKQADIAILRTLGASPRSIMKIFIIQGGLVGLIGTLTGVGLGVLVAVNIDVIVPFIEQLLGVQFLAKDVYVINTMPSDLRGSDVLKVGGMAIVLAFLATLYPSWSAARVKPAEVLRYE